MHTDEIEPLSKSFFAFKGLLGATLLELLQS